VDELGNCECPRLGVWAFLAFEKRQQAGREDAGFLPARGNSLA
jgi:hypothetical protein